MKSSIIAERLDQELPKIIAQIAEDNQVLEYSKNPDFKEERLRKWHQYGLLTHTRKVRQAFLGELTPLLTAWKLYSPIERYLSQDIAGLTRQDLFEISIVPHDLGKIICLNSTKENREHEIASADLVGQRYLKDKLVLYGINEEQLSYIQTCIANHDALGKKVRDALKHSGKLNLEYLAGIEAREICRNFALEYPSTKLDIGLFFICDSLGKLDVKIEDSTSDYEKRVIAELKSRNLPEELKFGVIQQPVNMFLSRIYLEEALAL